MKSGTILMMLVMLLSTATLPAQIERPYEAVVLNGRKLPELIGQPTDNWRAYRYDSTNEKWQEVAIQIDEYNPDAPQGMEYFDTNDDSAGIFDMNDEIVFMAQDIGDVAPAESWPAGSDSVRWQLTLYDSTDGSRGVLYLIRVLPLGIHKSPAYHFEFVPETDVISTENYQIGFDMGQEDTTGQLMDARILSGTGVDILDRMKIRLYGIVTLLIPLPLQITEEAIRADSAFAKIGPVRVIHNLKAAFALTLAGFPFRKEFLQTSFFYPWHGEFHITGIPIQDMSQYADVIYARLSWDMNAAATGMTFFSETNPAGIIIDGIGDHEGISTQGMPGHLDWTMVTGTAGTMLNVFHLPALGDEQGIFYFDNTDNDTLTTGDPEDTDPYTSDTGDNVAYGENGYFVHQNISGEKFDFVYMNYFLPPNIIHADASAMVNKLRHPPGVVAIKQERSPSAVAQNTTHPALFQLYANYPNPFNAGTVITFTMSQPAHVRLEILDMKGRLVNRLVDTAMSPAQHRVVWDGRDNNGQMLPSGVYLYRLSMNSQSQVRRLVMLK